MTRKVRAFVHASKQTNLQYAGKLRVSVWDMPSALVVCKGTYDIAKRQQALVDVDALCQVVASCSCVFGPLTSCTMGQRVPDQVVK